MKAFRIISLLWLVGWWAGAVGFFYASRSQGAEAGHLAKPLTTLDMGAEVHLDGKIAPASKVRSPFHKQECVASLLNVYYVTTYRDPNDHEKFVRQTWLASTRRTGPESLDILAGGSHLALPLKLWTAEGASWKGPQEDVDNLPPELQPSPEELQQVKRMARGDFLRFSVEEQIITEGMPVFVAAAIQARDPATGALRLGPDPTLARVMLSPGSQAQAVERLRGSSSGLRIAGGIFLGLGLLPLLFSIWLSRRKGRERGAPPSIAA